jgi:hypothetical protein
MLITNQLRLCELTCAEINTAVLDMYILYVPRHLTSLTSERFRRQGAPLVSETKFGNVARSLLGDKFYCHT